jgi:rod shape-determining protein MreD
MVGLVINLILLVLVLIQTTLVNYIAVLGVKPDIAMIGLVFFSHKQGRLVGETGGFISGLTQDTLSLSPLGYHAFSRTLIGFLFGTTAGKIHVDPVFLPMLLTAIASLIKFFQYALLGLLFNIQTLVSPPVLQTVVLETIYNLLLSPLVFNGLTLAYQLFPRHWREYQL